MIDHQPSEGLLVSRPKATESRLRKHRIAKPLASILAGVAAALRVGRGRRTSPSIVDEHLPEHTAAARPAGALHDLGRKITPYPVQDG